MAEPNRYEFSYKEVAEALVRQQGIKEGIWSVTLKFGIGAIRSGASPNEAVPTAVVPIAAIGLGKVDKVDHLSVDASTLSPRPKKKS